MDGWMKFSEHVSINSTVFKWNIFVVDTTKRSRTMLVKSYWNSFLIFHLSCVSGFACCLQLQIPNQQPFWEGKVKRLKMWRLRGKMQKKKDFLNDLYENSGWCKMFNINITDKLAMHSKVQTLAQNSQKLIKHSLLREDTTVGSQRWEKKSLSLNPECKKGYS